MWMIFPTLKENFLKTLHSKIPYNACQNFGPISGLKIFVSRVRYMPSEDLFLQTALQQITYWYSSPSYLSLDITKFHTGEYTGRHPMIAWTPWFLNRCEGILLNKLCVKHITMKKHGESKKKPGPRMQPSGPTTQAVRFNGAQHWTARGNKPNFRCRQCSSRTVYVCKMCEIPLHPKCMKPYHTKEWFGVNMYHECLWTL